MRRVVNVLSRRPWIVTVTGLLMLLGACALGTGGTYPSSSDARPAASDPFRFEPEPPVTRVAPADTIAGEGCRNPTLDPRDGTRLTLVRSLGGTGDYRVPAGMYGVGAGELLRLECAAGRVVGIVVE